MSARRPSGPSGLSAAELLVRTLENEGVRFVFGIPGEENIRFTRALDSSSIRYILTRHEQGASFMAEMYARVTGQAGVVSATLGPGAINLQLGVADAHTNCTPLVAISAQVGQHRNYKESHQFVDLVSMFAPITKWSAAVPSPQAIPEMIRKAFKTAETERPGAVYLAVPEDVDEAATSPRASSCRCGATSVRAEAPAPGQIERAAEVLRAAQRPDRARRPRRRAGGRGRRPRPVRRAARPAGGHHVPRQGRACRRSPAAIGTIGFMRRDYVNFGFEDADVIIAVGYELQEFDPARINPDGDKKIIHIHRFPAEVDAHYDIDVGIEGDIGRTLEALAAAVGDYRPAERRASEASAHCWPPNSTPAAPTTGSRSRPQRIVADTRDALGRDDIVLVDTGALKMWMARLYPTYAPNTCLISNGLSTMAWTLPGAMGAKIAQPDRKVLVVTGDGAFLMNSQEIETAVREHIPLVVLVWVDNGYGLISWKMDLELGGTTSTRRSPTPTSCSTPRASAPRDTASPRPTSCCRRCARRSPTTACRSSPARSTTRDNSS